MDGKNIREVTSKGISYIDDAGQRQLIDFEACLRNSTTPSWQTLFQK
ncbi:MAG: hypothetical protein K8L91_20110 [Anaerolineae bacterium]|nr:hypothetical protein [Anaerolineae bacterium]